MKKSVVITLLIICWFASDSYPQKLTEPKLVGSWIGGEDFGEFIFHATDTLKYLLNENPNGKIVARICSKNKMPLALVSSNGFGFQFSDDTKLKEIPADHVFFARSSKCGEKTEQYWFVPENSTIAYDEIIPIDKVKVTRLLGEHYENSHSVEAKKEFAGNLKQFIDELKNNPEAEGFIIRNIGTKNVHFKRSLRQIQRGKIGKDRIHTVIKRLYQSHYPEFMTVAINR